MPKLISIKRPFARKTANIKNEETKASAEFFKDAENDCIKMAKIASGFKKVFKSSDYEKMEKFHDKYESEIENGTLSDDKADELKKLKDKVQNKFKPLGESCLDLLNNSNFFKCITDPNELTALQEMMNK